MPIFTKEIFNLGLSSRGGINAKQRFLITGKRLPELRRGWKQRLYGKELPDEIINQYIALRDSHLVSREKKEFNRKAMENLSKKDRRLLKRQQRKSSVSVKSKPDPRLHDPRFQMELWLESEPPCQPFPGRTESDHPSFIPVGVTLSWEEQYRHPNWQRMRLYILNRDQFQCLRCGNTQEELHVHHVKYSGRFIWLTPADKLITLCNTCHSKQHGK